MSLGLELEQCLAIAQRIRDDAGLGQDVAIVIFCVPTIREGAENGSQQKCYVTRPDNFNQLRTFLHRLLQNDFLPTEPVSTAS